MNKVYLSIGSNLGDRDKFLANARNGIEFFIGKIIAVSSIYKTEPWGFSHDNYFLNQVVLCETRLSPTKVLDLIQQIENENQRERSGKGYDARTLDIDVLFFDDLILNSKILTIPHPLLHSRNFVLLPLNEISPDYCHPVFKKRIKELVNQCTDESVIIKIA